MECFWIILSITIGFYKTVVYYEIVTIIHISLVLEY